MSTFTHHTLIKTDQELEKVQAAVVQSLQRFGGDLERQGDKIIITEGKKTIPFSFLATYHSIINFKKQADGFLVETTIDREVKGVFWLFLLLLFTPLFAVALIAISTMFSNPAKLYHRFLKKIRIL